MNAGKRGARGGAFREPRVVRLAVRFVALCDQIGPNLARVPYLNAQLQDAAASVVANLGEALDERSRGDQRRFFRYALRSAGECQRLLRAIRRVGALSTDQTAEVLHSLVAVKMDIKRLLDWAS